ncbi:hypothetical protein [Microbispora sp. ATCC PTA-5024]|uniref:hypothetical protein n=1 Tax=Microbispora sp. ATCC PTA-5024 TaxID=316330 RepID=UPI0003DBBB7C|nr:hypothetical protein [Microbispora sp. ATCC PTA-5024]ETK35811.1 hypothetical protein MPTA5024_12090 [Microbispora sp. ATCC PTA-5024]
MTGTSAYGRERRAYLEALAARLPERGLAGRLVGADDPVLWVWHPRTRRQTIVFASPSREGWTFLWSPDGQESVEEPGLTAETIRKQLSQPV